MKIVLISCSAKKMNSACTAQEMYSPSSTFLLSLEYAKKYADRIYILSAKHGLLDPLTRIEPYNLNLAQLSLSERKEWAERVLKELQVKCDLQNDHLTFLAGKNYYKYLTPALSNFSIPLEHESLGKRPTALRGLIRRLAGDSDQAGHSSQSEGSAEDFCTEIHSLFNQMRRFSISEIDEVRIENGIYVLFERGENYKSMERIVRVGTHTSGNRLRQRLKDHFLRENKDGSIFRKNVGKALLNSRESSYLQIWTLDTSKPENRTHVDSALQSTIELEVTRYLRENVTFTVLRVDDPDLRLRLEKALISSLNHSSTFLPSEEWLGNNSPEDEIRSSGLWLKRGLNSPTITHDEIDFIRRALKESEKPTPLINKSAGHGFITGNTTSGPQRNQLREGGKVPGQSEIREFILKKFASSKVREEESCTLVSGDIAAALRIKNRMPSICSVMYSLMRPGDEILSSTPSGQSSTIKIKYFMK